MCSRTGLIEREECLEMIKSIMSSDEKVSISDSTPGNTYLLNYHRPAKLKSEN